MRASHGRSFLIVSFEYWSVSHVEKVSRSLLYVSLDECGSLLCVCFDLYVFFVDLRRRCLAGEC